MVCQNSRRLLPGADIALNITNFCVIGRALGLQNGDFEFESHGLRAQAFKAICALCCAVLQGLVFSLKQILCGHDFVGRV